MTTTYCTRPDIETLLSPAGLLACIDDDEDGAENPAESLHVTNAIQRAATWINQRVQRQYVLADVTANAWLKWANATLAAAYLTKRRNNPASESLAADVQQVMELLEEVSWGRANLPEQTPSFDYRGTVSNMRPELWKAYQPIRVVPQESTGPSPANTVQRAIANQSGVY